MRTPTTSTPDVATLDSLRIVPGSLGPAGVVIALMLIMFGVALGLRGEDFRNLAQRPGILISGVLTQVVMLPAMTFAGSAVLGLTIIYRVIYFFPMLQPAVGLLLSISIVHNAAAFLTGATPGSWNKPR